MWGNIFNLSWKLFKNIYDTKYNHTAFLVNVATDIYSYIGSNYKNFLLFINTLVPPPCLNWKLKVIQYWDFVKNSRNRLVNTRFETTKNCPVGDTCILISWYLSPMTDIYHLADFMKRVFFVIFQKYLMKCGTQNFSYN